MLSPPAHDVSIRPYGPDDLPLLERLLGDPAMTVHLGGPESPEALTARHQRYLALDRASGAVFTVLVGPERVAAGWVGYWESEWPGEKVWECGWHVLTEHQGRGVATKATALVLDEVRARSTYRYVHAFPSVDNAAFNALCRRLGFELLGEEDVEYPRGSMMRSNNWRLDLHRWGIQRGTGRALTLGDVSQSAREASGMMSVGKDGTDIDGGYTKEEALAFIESMRLTVAGRVGFRWLGEKLSALADYVESVTAENERLNAYLDRVGARDDYVAFLQVGVDVGEVAPHDGRDAEEDEEDNGPLLP
ncbi:MAG: GNAT family N-acetyltransferase [Anaerosomatales bacterium]